MRPKCSLSCPDRLALATSGPKVMLGTGGGEGVGEVLPPQRLLKLCFCRSRTRNEKDAVIIVNN